MKKLLCVLLLLTTRLLAVSPVPYTESMSFSFRIDGTGSSSMTVYDETGTEYILASASGTTIESSTGTAWMIPGKAYTISFWGSGPPDYSMSFIPPTGYSVYVNGVATNLVSLSPGTGSHVENYKVELRPAAGEAGGMWGQFSGIALGRAISWGVGLGDLRTGRSAGGIQFKKPDLSGSPASRTQLFYATPPANVGQIVVVYDGPSNNTLRQVCTPIGFTDLVDVTGGYEIRCYTWGQVASWTGTMYTFTGSPWKTIKVESPATNQLKITETQGSVVRVSQLGWAGATSASGGTITTGGGYTIHTFNSSGTFTVNNGISSVDYLVVAGGGGGGSAYGGGGGGGGVLTATGYAVSSGVGVTVTVGAGGAGGVALSTGGSNGSNSAFGSIIAIGGGGGGLFDETNGNSGGSGGGGGGGISATGSVGGAGTSGQGYAGGHGEPGNRSAAGGGGAGGVGGNQVVTYSGDGGVGVSSSISGSSVTYGGGGGGGGDYNYLFTPGNGGSGGGGAGGANAGGPGYAGTANTGGGGGGASYNLGSTGAGGNGGSGVVIIRYLTPNIFTWTLQEGDGTTIARTTVHTSTVPTSGQRDDVAAVYNGNSTSSANLVSKTKYHYVNQAWGEELDSIIADPDTAALTTSYTYFTNSSNLGNYRRVQSVTWPTGGWTAYQYYDDWDRRGQLQYQFQPWLDSPTLASSASTTTGHVIYYQDYVADWTSRHTRPTVRQEFINNTLVGQTSWSHGDVTGSGEPRAYMTINSYRDGSNYQSDYAESYRADADPDFAGEPYQTKSSSQAQDSVSISRGTFNTTTKAFTVGSTGDHWREIHFHGSTSGSGADAVTSFNSQTCPSVYMIPDKSTLDVTIRIAQGYVYRTETWVYTGSGAFSLMTAVDFDYDGYGNLTQRWASTGNGALTGYSYTNGRLMSVVDPTGIETDYTYDVLGRVATSIKKGASAGTYAAQADITTTYTLDAVGHATQTVVSGGTHSLTTSSSYDLAGRLYQTVAPGSYTTGIAYSSGGRVVTATLPGGATKVTEVYPDGHAKSITGTAVVAQYSSYTVNTSPGTVTTQTNFGTSTSTNLGKTTNDWLGREITEVKPAWSGGNATRNWTYDGTTGLLTKLSQTGLADTLYSYDTLGQLVREGLDVNANGLLDVAGSDRITDHAYYYFLYSGGWYFEKTTSTYATASSGTATLVDKKNWQLSNLPSGTFSSSYHYDVFGNATVSVQQVNRSSKLVTTTTTYPDSSTSAVQIAYNGLVVSSQDKTNLTTTFGFDDLGRQVTSVDPRTGTTTTAYVSSTSQVNTVTDPASIVQATYTYDSAGRVATMTNALSKICRYTYTNRNEPYQVWGDTDYPVQYGYDSWGHRTTMSTYRGGSGWTGTTWPSSPGTADTTTWNFHEPTGLLSSKVDASSKTVSYTYTDAGQMHVRTGARSITTTYGYDAATGELTSVGYSDSTPGLTYTYNRLGKQATVADVSGTRTFNYNLSGTLEMQSEDLPSFYGSRRITYPVSASSGVVGRPTGLQLGTSGSPTNDQSITYGYDTYGRFNSFGAASQTFSYGYQSNSNLIATVTDSGANYTDTRTYDSYHDWTVDRKTQISTTTKAEFAYTPDNLGRATKATKTGELYNNYGNGTQGLDTYYAYDDRSELIGEKTKLGGSSTILTGRNDGDGTTPGYAYDSIGNRSSATHNGNSASYTTNALNQYTQRGVPGYFDVAGADTATTVTVARSGGTTDTAARNGNYFFDSYALTNTSSAVSTTLTVTGSGTFNIAAFLALTPEPFSYDYDGNLTSDGRWDYTYDAENRLVNMQTHTALSPTPVANADAQRLEFTYDYLGRRVEKLVRGGYNGTSYTTVVSDEKFVYNGWNPMAKLNAASSNALMASYYWGMDLSGSLQGAGGVGGLLMIVDSGNSYLPAYDAMGNVHALINASSGVVAAAYEYDAFGRTLRESGTYAASNPYQYSTKYTDVETGLVYYGLRYYSPSLGRFINKDPIEEKGGRNLYAFCGNNGINRRDYLGNTPTDDDMAARWRHINFGAANREGAALGGNVFMGPSSDAIGQQEVNAGVFNGPAPVPTGNKHMSNAGSAGAGSEGNVNGDLVLTDSGRVVTTNVTLGPIQFGDTVPEYYNEPTAVPAYVRESVPQGYTETAESAGAAWDNAHSHTPTQRDLGNAVVRSFGQYSSALYTGQALGELAANLSIPGGSYFETGVAVGTIARIGIARLASSPNIRALLFHGADSLDSFYSVRVQSAFAQQIAMEGAMAESVPAIVETVESSPQPNWFPPGGP